MYKNILYTVEDNWGAPSKFLEQFIGMSYLAIWHITHMYCVFGTYVEENMYTITCKAWVVIALNTDQEFIVE